MNHEYLAVPLHLDLEATARVAVQIPEITGLEVSMGQIVPNNDPLPTGAGIQALADRFNTANVERVHCSYWGSPTNFLTKINFRELVDRFGGLDGVRAYYGDLTGHHMMRRWRDEYALARMIGAHTYVFHLIDYATVDGAWEFTIPKHTIRRAMASILQQFLLVLDEEELLDNSSPLIEIENAGWGLEHGMQTAEDVIAILDEVVDPYGKVRIGWDINHVLHAIGVDLSSGHARFQLPENEVDEMMRELERSYGADPTALAHAWIEHQLEHPVTRLLNGTLHISDRELPGIEYFRNGALTPPLLKEMQAQPTREDQSEYGYQIVLRHFDSHLPLGHGCLDPERLVQMIERLTEYNRELELLHELKTSRDLAADVGEQRRLLMEAYEQLSA